HFRLRTRFSFLASVCARAFLSSRGTVSIHPFVTSSRSAPLAVELAPISDGLDAPLATEDVVTDPRDRQAAKRAEAGGAIDLHGNDVSDAVAEYTVDPAGSL